LKFSKNLALRVLPGEKEMFQKRDVPPVGFFLRHNHPIEKVWRKFQLDLIVFP